jgi:two-component system chemotaxis response regulator CheY
MARILVVDDDPDILKLVEKVLRTGNHEVFTAHDAIQAMDYLNTSIYDLLITDANIPHFSGFELARTVKNNKRFQRMAICMLTGLREKKDIEKAASAGVDGYIVKPIDPSLLLGKVESIFKKHPPMEKATYHIYEGSTSSFAQVTLTVKATQLSEFGMTLKSTVPVLEGLELKIHSDLFKRMEMKAAPKMKVVACRKIADFENEIDVAFIGVSDAFYQKVRDWIHLQGQISQKKKSGAA